MVVGPAPIAGSFVLGVAAHAAAVEIAQAAGILDRLPKGHGLDPCTGRLTDVVPEGPKAHDQRHNGVEKGGAEDRDHRVVRHHPIESPCADVAVKEDCRIMRGHETDDEGDNAGRSGQRDPQPIAIEDGSQEARPGIARIAVGTDGRERSRHIDGKLVRWRKLAVHIAGAAGMAQVGQIVEITVPELTPQLHRGEHRAEPLAIAAGVADRHQSVGFCQSLAGMDGLGKGMNVHAPISFVSDPRRACAAALCPARRPNTLPMVMPMPAA